MYISVGVGLHYPIVQVHIVFLFVLATNSKQLRIISHDSRILQLHLQQLTIYDAKRMIEIGRCNKAK